MLRPTLASLIILYSSLGLGDVLGIQLPRPKGPFEVGTTSFELTDHSRLDPFAPTPQSRSVQLSLHYPIANGSSLPFSIYLPALTANDTESVFGALPGSLQNVSSHARLDAPVVLFSPGFGVTRLLYATFAQNMASEGYVVVSIDHPHDASIVELSDGRVVPFNISDTPENIDLAVEVRAADARFVLDELTTGRNFKLSGLKKGGLDTSHVGFFGHSLGGATAAATMVRDRRVTCGVNMDGSFVGPDIQRGLSKPFMIMASEGDNRTTDATWAEVWPKLRGFKREIEVKGTMHLSYTDIPVVGDLLGMKSEEVFGTIAGKRFDEIQHAYLTAFFNFALRGKKKGGLLDGPSKGFPEVVFAPQV